MAIKLGQLIIELVAKSDSFAKGLTDMRDLTFSSSGSMVNALDKVGVTISKLKFENAAQIKRSFDLVSSAALGLATGAVTGAAGALALIAEKSISAGARMYDLAQSTGVSVETLSTFSYIAKQSGVDVDTMSKRLEIFSKNALQSASGTGTAVNAFRQLGINVVDSNGKLKSVGDLIGEVAAKFSVMENGTQKTGLAIELFGRGGAALIPMLNRGKEGIADLAAEAQRLGVVFSTETAANEKQLEESIIRLRGSIEGAGLQITAGMVPALTQLTAGFTQGASSGTALRDIGEAIGGAMKLAALSVNEAAEDYAKLGVAISKAAEIGSHLDPVNGAAMRKTAEQGKAFFEALVTQAEQARDRINGITQQIGLPKVPNGGTGSGTTFGGVADLSKDFATLGQQMKELESIGNSLQLKGLDPLSKSLEEYRQALEKIGNVQASFPQSLRATADYEIATRKAEQDRVIALAALNRELDSVANEARVEAMKKIAESAKGVLQVISLMPLGGFAVPTLNIDPVAARVEEMTRDLTAFQSAVRAAQDQSLTVAQNLAVREAELQAILDQHLITQEQYNRLKDDAIEKAQQERVQELLRPGQSGAAGIQAAVLELQITTANAARNMYQVMSGAFQGIEQSFESAFAGIISGTETASSAFKKMAQAIISEIAHIIAQMLVLRMVTPLLGGLFGGGLPGLGDPFSAFVPLPSGIVTGHAGGGSMSPGDISWVGERGPELFVPDSAGTIVPNDALGGNKATYYDFRGAQFGGDPGMTKQAVMQALRLAEDRAVARADRMRQESARRGMA